MIISLFILTKNLCHAKEIKCTTKNNTKEFKVSISLKNNMADVSLTLKDKTKNYEKCSSFKDSLGYMIDCNTGNRDLLIWLERKTNNKFGEIISGTHKLHSMITCKN